MIDNITIAFIGPGVMAEAMLSGILRNKLTQPGRILISGPAAERNEELHKKYGVQPFTNNGEAASKADVIILSVKPQRLEKVLEDMRDHLKPDALVLSIVAALPSPRSPVIWGMT
jgi:pyrroline-5-carboxylate reductase